MQSINNWTNTPLAAGATYTGTAENIAAFPSTILSCKTDTSGTIYLDYSVDGTNWDSTLSWNVAPNTTEVHRITNTRAFARVRFTNVSATAQTYLRLQMLSGSQTSLTSPLGSIIQGDADTLIVRPTDYSLDIARGLVENVTFNNKFGRNAATATGDAIWALSSAYTEPATAERCNVVSTSTQDDFGGGTGAGKIIITGINDSYDLVTEVVELNGTTNVLTANSYWNIHRAYVVTAGSGGTAVGTITIISSAAGTPTLANIAIGYNQTQSTIYMVPRNHTAYINLPNVSGQNTTANALCDIGCFKKEFGGVFRVQMDFNLTGDTTAYMPKVFGAPLKCEAKSLILFKCIAASGGGTWDIAVDYDIWLVQD